MAWRKGGGKGGRGGRAGGPRRGQAPKAIPGDFTVDKEARHAGTVTAYNKWSGYGFIKPNQQGLVPEDKLYVHWSNIQSEDRFPFLQKDMEVEFGLMTYKATEYDGRITLRAKTVTLPGGSMVAVQDNLDAEKKTFIGGQNLRYTGQLKFYNPKQGFGYVTMDEGYQMEEEVRKELRVEEAEVSCGGKRPRRWLEGLSVEFGIWKTKTGQHLVYNMTLPGGVPMTQENMEHRQPVSGALYQGQIAFWSWKQGWGHIEPDASAKLPPAVTAQMEEMVKSAQEKGKKPEGSLLYFRKADLAGTSWLKKGQAVTFQVYTDDKGAGATGINVVG